ncbi:MAG: EAL domain-containing protein, partial [Pseudohongiellaceae bacterium]
ALQESEFVPFYQPIFSNRGSEIVGAEVLVRWRHPHKGMLSPGEFIPLAEQTGLIDGISHSVVEQALADFREWKDAAILTQDFFLTLNVSPVQFQTGEFADSLASQCDQAGIAPQEVVVELTETVFMEINLATADHFRELRGRGFRIAIDDFGSGYSSLSLLSDLPADILKIDQTFVHQIGRDNALVPLVLSIGHLLGIRTVAEGVETKAQLSYLQRTDIDFLQGFFLARPMTKDDLTLMMESHPQSRVVG